jgi:succinate dehydrogenase/fumarate reductase flavoprotein subunit
MEAGVSDPKVDNCSYDIVIVGGGAAAALAAVSARQSRTAARAVSGIVA